MSGPTGTRSDGVKITLSSNPIGEASRLYAPFTGPTSGAHFQIASPVWYQISFSVPQILTYVSFKNYSGNSTSTVVQLLTSNDGEGFSQYKQMTTSGSNSAVNALIIDNPVAFKHYRFFCPSGGNYTNSALLLMQMVLKGYSYSD